MHASVVMHCYYTIKARLTNNHDLATLTSFTPVHATILLTY